MSIESFFAQLSQQNYQRDLSYNEEKVHAWEKVENLFKSGFSFPIFHVFGHHHMVTFEDDIKIRFMEHWLSKDDCDELRLSVRKKLESVSEMTRITKQEYYKDLVSFVDNQHSYFESLKTIFPEIDGEGKEEAFIILYRIFEKDFLHSIEEIFDVYWMKVFEDEIQLKFMEQYFSTEDCELRVLMRKKLETVSEITRLKHSEDFITLMRWAYEYV